MKELPYFRFTPSEWQNGKISLEDFEMQGYFINVCSYYWICDCSITRVMLEKKFKSAINLLELCLNLDIFKHDPETDFISICFLNEQFDALSKSRKLKQSAGSKGGKKKASNATTLLQQKPSYKDKDKDKDNDKNKGEESEFPPQIQRRFLLEIEEVEEYLLSEIEWKTTRIATPLNLNIEKVDFLIKEFSETLKGRGEEQKTPADAKSHFYNWIKNKPNGTHLKSNPPSEEEFLTAIANGVVNAMQS